MTQILLRIVFTTIITAGLIFNAPASVLASSVTFDGCRTLATVKSGDEIELNVKPFTTDPNEAGSDEGEFVTLSVPGHSYVFTFNERPALIITKATANGAVSACVVNADGDESVTVDVTVNPHVKNFGFTQDNRDAFARTSGKQALQVGGVALIQQFVKAAARKAALSGSTAAGLSATELEGVAAVLGWGTALVGLGALTLAYLAKDPPDSNFKVIVQPHPPVLSGQPVTTKQGVTRAEADATNALFINQEQTIGLLSATLTSINRASGAHDAGDVDWEARQEKAAQQYASQTADSLRAQAKLLADASAAFQSDARFSGLTFTRSDVLAMEKSIAQNGMPDTLSRALVELGADKATQSDIQQSLFAQDIDAVAALGGGKFAQVFADPSVLGALQSTTQALNQFAGPVPPSTSPVPPSTNPAPPTTSPVPASTSPLPPSTVVDGTHCGAGQTPAFVLGFAELKATLGNRMGAPLTCEYPDPKGTGDVEQNTTTGLAFWRKRTNTPTFTDGWQHWAHTLLIFGMGTLQERTAPGWIFWAGASIDPPPDARGCSPGLCTS